LKAVGILNRSDDLEVYLFESSVNSDIVIACPDKFSEKIEIEIVLVIDNTSIYTSNNLVYEQAECQEKN